MYLKKYLLGLSLLLVPWLTYAQAKPSYTIRGQLGQLSAPTKVYLVTVSVASDMAATTVLDSATLHNGTFELNGVSRGFSLVALVLPIEGNLQDGLSLSTNRASLYLEPGLTVLTSPDSLPNATFRGGPLTTDLQRLLALYKPILNKLEQRPHTKPQFETLKREYAQCSVAFIKANPNSWVSLHVLLGLTLPMSANLAELKQLYKNLSPAIRHSLQGRQYAKIWRSLAKDLK